MRHVLLAVVLVGAVAMGVATADTGSRHRLVGRPEGRSAPSVILFPAQEIPLRFSHAEHLREHDMECLDCHRDAESSQWASDDLLPPKAVCRECHDVDRENPDGVSDPPARCSTCHDGFEPGRRVARVRMPRPYVRFPHGTHVRRRGIACARCHGDIASRDLATRHDLPVMETCLECHTGMAAPAGCTICHIEARDGGIRTTYPAGRLSPPRWMRGAEHTPEFTFRHARVAGADSSFCASCHTENDCLGCHEASNRVRNRYVHPNDWITTHPVSARRDDPRCASCHREQSFCLGCHRRAGVVASGATAGPPGVRFHPAPEVWVEALGGPSALHHSHQARRNIQTCVSCHAEHDCLGCHALDTYRPGGVNPHPRGAGWHDRCGRLMRRNPTPCLLCHADRDALLEQCR